MKRSSKAAEAPAPPPASTPKTSAKGWATNPISQMYARITVGRRRETGDWSHSEEEKVAEARAEDVPAGAVRVHVYDLVEEDYQEVLTGYGFTTGSSVIAVNSGTYHLGWGAFHAGVEVGGLEYSFGSCARGTGVYAVEPTRAPGYKFRETLEMGETPLSRREARTLMLEMRREWPGASYNVLRRNCCTFADAACARLGVKPVPAWVNHLANSLTPVADGARAVSHGVTRAQLVCAPLCEAQDADDGADFGHDDALYSVKRALFCLPDDDEGDCVREVGQARPSTPLFPVDESGAPLPPTPPRSGTAEA